MATINSAASGNFNSGATWVGGVVPTIGDTAVALAGHTITINSNVACDEVTNANNSGYFNLLDTYTLTANVTGGASAANNGTVRYNGTTSATIVGNVTNTQAANFTAAVYQTGTGTLNITGNITGGTANISRYGVLTIAGNITVTGNVTSGTTAGSSGIESSGISSVITVTGNVSSAGTGSVNVDGILASGTTVNIFVTGAVTGGTSTGTAPGVRATSSASIIDVVGSINATSTQHGVSPVGSLLISGNINDANNGKPAYSVISTTFVRVRVTTGAVTTHYTPAIGAGSPVLRASMDYITNNVPVPADVREGLSYADDQFEGTLAVPPAGSVALGVPVDNTTGTAALTPEAVWEYVISGTAAQTRLANIPTEISNAQGSIEGEVAAAQSAIEAKIDETEQDIIDSVEGNALTAAQVWDHEIEAGVQAGDRLLDTATSAELAEAGITVEEIWDHPVEDVTSTGSIGVRLKNVATVESTGSQIAAFENG